MSQKFLVEETVREDSLRIITKHIPYTKRVRISISALTGSAYDPPGKDGLNHSFEHMAFKGTTTRTASELLAELDRYAFSNNAFTAQRETCYWGEGVYTHRERLAEILFDLYRNSIFPQDELEKEKRVVLSEIARNKDSDGFVALVTLWEKLWRENPVRKSGAGLPEDVKSVSRDLLLEVHKKWYVPSNTVVVGVGRIRHQDLVDQVNAIFPLAYENVLHPVWDDECDELPQERDIVLTRPGRNRSIVLLGAKIPVLTEEDRLKLNLFVHIFAQGMNSILWREVREKRGLVYTVNGLFDEEPKLANYAYFMTEALPQVTDEVRDLMREVVFGHPCDDKKHFECVRDKYRDKLSVSLESVSDWFSIIDNVMIGEGKSARELEGRIREWRRNILRVKLDDIIELRERLFKPERFVSVVLRPE